MRGHGKEQGCGAQWELPVEGDGDVYDHEEEIGGEASVGRKKVTYFILFIHQTSIALVSHWIIQSTNNYFASLQSTMLGDIKSNKDDVIPVFKGLD